ncbi:MAG: putative rane transport protein [Burkholderiales bacterium]|nr:putative rane transport protein [Burkholderiales bacterium]
MSYVYRMVNAVLAPTLAQEFGLSAGGLGLLSSVYFFSFALFQLPLGLLLDRFGPRKVNALLLLVAAAGGAWFAHAESAGAAIAARAIIGIGVSACLMASFTAFVLWYPPERIATMNGVAFSAGAVGAMTATVPLEMLLRVWPWRDAFMLIVAATLAVSLVLWLWVPEKNAQRRGDCHEQLRGSEWSGLLRGLGQLLADPAFRRIAICLGLSQFAAVALQTLWIATWLRDVAGYSQAEVARGLLAVNVAMIAGYMTFGRAADVVQRRGKSPLPLLLFGVGLSSASLLLIIVGLKSLLLWCVFVAAGTAVVLGYAILSRRYPAEMSGRANTAINVFGFVGMFSGQWGIGLVLDLWPPSATGYAAEAYPWALGMVWAAQLAGLVWLWLGRRLLKS